MTGEGGRPCSTLLTHASLRTCLTVASSNPSFPRDKASDPPDPLLCAACASTSPAPMMCLSHCWVGGRVISRRRSDALQLEQSALGACLDRDCGREKGFWCWERTRRQRYHRSQRREKSSPLPASLSLLFQESVAFASLSGQAFLLIRFVRQELRKDPEPVLRIVLCRGLGGGRGRNAPGPESFVRRQT